MNFRIILSSSKPWLEAIGMAQWLKVFATKPDNMVSICQTHTVENKFPQVSTSPPGTHTQLKYHSKFFCIGIVLGI